MTTLLALSGLAVIFVLAVLWRRVDNLHARMVQREIEATFPERGLGA